MTPALFQRTSSLDSLLRNSTADAQMVVKSPRSSRRKTKSPLEFLLRDLMPLIVASAFRGRPCSDIDLCIAGVEDFGEEGAETSVRSGQDEDLESNSLSISLFKNKIAGKCR